MPSTPVDNFDAEKLAQRIDQALTTMAGHSPGEDFGDLRVAARHWPAGTADQPLVKSAVECGAWDLVLAAMGRPESALLTTDGRTMRRDGWCVCSTEPAADTWVCYQRWIELGMAAHGYLCPTCRRLTQSG